MTENSELIKKAIILIVVNYILDFEGTIEEITEELNISIQNINYWLNDENLAKYVGLERAEKVQAILKNDSIQNAKQK